MIDSRKTNLSLATRDHFTVQSGTIPNGLTGSKAKYPVNSSEISINHNQQVLLVKPISITQDFTIGLTGDWNRKIRPGNSIEVQRGTINSDYTVKTLKYLPGENISTISLSHKRNVVNLLDPFISTVGYDLPATDTYIQLNRKVESPNNVETLVKDFSVKLIQETDPLKFSVKAFWTLDPKVSAAKLRWRSVPRVSSQSNLFFDVLTVGEYKSVPKLNVISSTGRKAEIEMTGHISTIDILHGGSGYSSAHIDVIGGGGTGAVITANLSGGSIGSINIVNSGQGYTSFPDLIVTGPSGSGASLKVNSMLFNKVHTIQQGGNYLSAPTVTIDIPYDDIITPAQIIAYTDLQNTSRVDYIKVTNSGLGYQDATIQVTGSQSLNATCVPVIVDGKITDIKVTYPGYGYSNSAYAYISSSTGTGAQAIVNLDLYSKWVYVDINYLDKFVILNGFNCDIPYEMEILASEDSEFRGLMKYTNLTHFQISKSLANQYIEYKPFQLIGRSPGNGENITMDDLIGYPFQLIFNHNTFIQSTGIIVTLHSYVDDTDTTYYINGGLLTFLNVQLYNVIDLDFSGYDFVPGSYYISFGTGILNDPAYEMLQDDWYFNIVP